MAIKLKLLNLDTLIEHFDQDWEFIKESLDLLSQQLDTMLLELSNNIQNEDFDNIQKAAHLLKGALSNFFIVSMTDCLQKIEVEANNKNLSEIKKYHQLFDNNIVALKNDIETILNK